MRPKVKPMQTQFQDGLVIQLNSINKPCLFAEVKINGVKVNFLIDTGLSSKTFEYLENAPTQLGSVFNTMTAADGGIIKTYGKSSLSFQLGDIDFTQDFIIADIGDLQEILGFEFLENNDIAVHIAKSYLEPRDKFVELFKVNNNIVSRIKISESLTILLNSTTTIIGKLDSFLTENAENMTFEPNNLDDVHVGVVISKLILKILLDWNRF